MKSAVSWNIEGEESPRRLAEAIGRLSERLEHLIDGRTALQGEGRGASGSARGSAPASPQDWSLGIEQALAEISGRQRMLDDGTADAAPRPPERSFNTASAPPQAAMPLQNIAGLEEHLRRISSQIETLQRPCPFEGEVAGMRRELAEIKHTLGEAMPRCAVEALEDQIRTLSGRVERGREGTDGVALAGVELRLARIGDTLNRLATAENLGGLEEEVSALSRKIDGVASHGPDPATMQQLETAIAELRHVSERVASGDALTKLANEVRGLAVKIDRFDSSPHGLDAVSALERRMEVLAGTLTEYASSVSRSAIPDVDALVQGVSDRLERLQAVRADQQAVEHLEEQIARLSEKLDASDGRMAQLGGMERTLADLFLQIEDTRAGAIEAAERAAKAAARELSVSEAGDQLAVEMLQRDLTDLRETQSISDRRTHQTLETLHDAVQRMVDRMANLDFNRPAEVHSGPVLNEIAPALVPALTEERAPPRPPVAPPAPPPPSARTVPPAVVPQPPAVPSQPASPPAAAFTPPSDRRPIDPTLPADTPLEPGSGAPRLRPGATPAERIAASEAALGPAKPKATPDRSEKANFIAAARRAAQAAAADAAAADPQADQASETRSGGIAQVLGKHKRSLLMATGAIVIAAGTLQFATGMLKTSDTPSAEAARVAPKDAREALAALTPPAATNTVAAEASPPAPAGSASAPTALNDPASGIPASLAPVNVGGDVTGSIPKPQNTAALTAPSPVGMLLAPPPATPADGSKLPPAIGANLRAAATNGDAGAAYEIALRFAEGRGVPASLEEAARWFRRAADHGLAPAQYRLGSLLEKGQGVKKDVEAARRLYTAAAEKGNAKAMHNLAVLYAEGNEGKPDYRTASQWFRKAAERGVADSQYNLGILFARGIGVEQNLAESYKWFSLAAAQGDQDAGRKRDDVGSRLDAQALAAAKLAAQTFQPEAQPDEAINVKAPPGGWDRATSAVTPAKKTNSKKTGSS
jgi:localization factor PodJL